MNNQANQAKTNISKLLLNCCNGRLNQLNKFMKSRGFTLHSCVANEIMLFGKIKGNEKIIVAIMSGNTRGIFDEVIYMYTNINDTIEYWDSVVGTSKDVEASIVIGHLLPLDYLLKLGS